MGSEFPSGCPNGLGAKDADNITSASQSDQCRGAIRQFLALRALRFQVNHSVDNELPGKLCYCLLLSCRVQVLLYPRCLVSQ